ncbi:MAG: TIGR03862 family flavoprotein [Pseudobdellovibrionaceae bacterium]|nr:TIGR03862 family flavoprotein [Pseudobdellovibrionaceae bacterium]
MPHKITIIGAGPGGLMAAEHLGQLGYEVHLYDHKPTPARKFLIAGLGGLNITHSEPIEKFLSRYGEAEDFIKPFITNFSPEDLRAWCLGLGEETFVGSSGRVFPKSFKASPLLRNWLKRLGDLGVTLHANHHWTGWDDDNQLTFNHMQETIRVKSDATILALGGASWPRLGSDASWIKILTDKDITLTAFSPSNCGFEVNWSEIFKSKFSGTPLKSITLSHNEISIKGEALITEKGIEGGGIYALSKSIRQSLEKDGRAILSVDLKPDLMIKHLSERLSKPRGRDSLTNFIRKHTGLSPNAINLLYEFKDDNRSLAEQIKRVDIPVTAPFAIERAISSAGGIKRDELNQSLMLKKLPSVFAIGEMIDWEAPTGGYLLQATFSMGNAVALGVDKYIKAYNI